MRMHELFGLSLAIEETVEGSLKCEAVHDVEFAPKYHSCGPLLGLLDAELAGIESEHLALLRHQLRDDSHLQVSRIVDRVAWSVHKDILLAAVAVHVDERQDLVLVLSLEVGLEAAAELLDGTDNRMQPWVRRLVPAIQIVA